MYVRLDVCIFVMMRSKGYFDILEAKHQYKRLNEMKSHLVMAGFLLRYSYEYDSLCSSSCFFSGSLTLCGARWGRQESVGRLPRKLCEYKEPSFPTSSKRAGYRG